MLPKSSLMIQRKRLQRHPNETVIASLAVGMTVGILIGWMLKRR